MSFVRFALFTFLVLVTSISKALACDTSKVARQVVKSLIAIEDIKGVKALYGGALRPTDNDVIFKIEPHYETTKDSYEVVLRSKDCRVLGVRLIGQSLPQND